MWPRSHFIIRAKCGVGLGYVTGHKTFFWWFPMFWTYVLVVPMSQVCASCALYILEAFYKWIESF